MGTHVPMSISRLGFIRPGQAYIRPKLWDFPMKITLILHFSFENCHLLSLAAGFVRTLGLLKLQQTFSVGQEGHTLQHPNASVGFCLLLQRKNWSKSEILSSKHGQITHLKERKQLSQIRIKSCDSTILAVSLLHQKQPIESQ